MQRIFGAADGARSLIRFFPARATVSCALAFAAFLGAVSFAYWPTITDLLDQWRPTQNVYGQGWLVLIIVGALCVRTMPQLLRGSSAFSPWLTAALAACVALWVLGYAADVGTAQTLAMPLIIMLTAVCMFGLRSLRLLGAPFCAILLILPLWNPLIAVLQPISVALTHGVTSLIGISVFVQGNFVMIPAGTFEVQEGCSGLAFLLSAGVFSVLAGEFCGMSLKHRVMLVVGSLLGSILLNCVRIVTIIVLGHLTDMQHPLVVNHGMIGDFYFLIFVIAPIVIFARIVGTDEQADQESERTSGNARTRRSYALVATILVTVFLVPIIARAWDAQRLDDLSLAIQLPNPAAGWERSEGMLPWQPAHPGAAANATANYTANDGTEVRMYVASYLEETQRQELIGMYSYVAEDLQQTQIINTPVEGLEKVSQSRVAQPPNGAWSVWHWYRIGETNTPDATLAKAFQVASWFRSPLPASVFVLATRCSENCDNTDRVLDDFLAAHPEIMQTVSVLEEGMQ